MPATICAVDVGTRSARAGLFDLRGQMLARGVHPIEPVESGNGHAEYRFADLWQAVGQAIRAALIEADTPASEVSALAFDATCSLVLSDRRGAPLILDAEGCDTIAWFDHRARTEAETCTRTGHRLIRHLGGAMSPEMQTPKLMWLKSNRPDLWENLGAACDLCDALTRRATGRATHSACALSAKWPFLPASGGWQVDFLEQVALADLREKAGLRATAQPIGSRAGALTAGAAAELGLVAGIPVAVGLVDAFAGALADFGRVSPGPQSARLTLITGTSSSVIATTDTPVFVNGIWGPFRDALIPGLWTSEGGQTAAGALLDRVLEGWPGIPDAPKASHAAVLERLQQLLTRDGSRLGDGLHILPDVSGNRSPLADASLRAVIHGASLQRGFDALCTLYWRTAVALALGARQIMDRLAEQGIDAPAIGVAGGMTRSPLLMQLYADVTGRPLHVCADEDGILLGTAIAAATGAGHFDDPGQAARAMTKPRRIHSPDPSTRAGYDRDYAAFQLMQRQRRELIALLRAPSPDAS